MSLQLKTENIVTMKRNCLSSGVISLLAKVFSMLEYLHLPQGLIKFFLQMSKVICCRLTKSEKKIMKI